MKLPEKNIYSETSNIGTEKSFGIGDKGFIFSILRNKLYSDPISSLIREYACNAKDANVEAGRPDTPIEIHLPNNFDMSLKIRDVGLGVSPDRMDDIFINYGSSTKRNTNNQVGAFGIGSKSAFAYTNQFSVITISDYQGSRKKRSYIAYIDPSEEGKMRLVSEEETTEPTGTEIVVGVEKNDLHTFIEKTLLTFKYWKIKPILSGINPIPEWPNYQKNEILVSSNWKLYSLDAARTYNQSKGYYEDNHVGPKAIIDGVCYNIESNNFHKLTNEQSSLLSHNILCEFPIGSLSLSANREFLHYDENTLNLIKERLNLIIKETPDLIKDSIKNSNNYIEASKKYRKLLSNIDYISKIDIDINWNGRVLLNTNYLDFGTNPKDFLVLTYFYKHSSRTYKDTLSCAGLEKNSWHRVHLDIDVPIYINNLNEKESPRSRVKTILTDNKEKKVQILTFKNNNSYSAVKDTFLKEKNIDLDWLEPKLLSTITPTKEQVVRKPSATKEKGKITVYKFDNKYQTPKQYIHKYWKPEQIDENDDEYETLFVVFNNASEKNVIPFSGYKFHQMDFTQIKKILNKDICGVREVDLDKIGANFTRLETYIDKKVSDIMALGISEEDILTVSHITGILQNNQINEKHIIAGAKLANSGGVFSSFLEEHDRLMNISEDTKEIIFMKHSVKMTDFNDCDTKLHKLATQIHETYPLLKYSVCGYGRSEKDYVVSLAKYIRMVDEKEKTIPLSNTGT